MNKVIFRNSNLSYLNSIAFLELDVPIGEELGWIGCGFFSSDSSILSKLYYKLSFPDSLQQYDFASNGDTLMLNYGRMDYYNSQFGILRLNSGFANSGMGGSSLFYKRENEYTAIGVSTFGSRYGQFLFTKRNFYLYKQIIENTSLTIHEPKESEVGFICYPNKADGQIIVKSTGDLKINQVRIFNISGQLVFNSNSTPSYDLSVESSSFNQGIYFIQVISESDKSYIFKTSVIR